MESNIYAFDYYPMEMWFYIISFLSFGEQKKMERVCKAFIGSFSTKFAFKNYAKLVIHGGSWNVIQRINTCFGNNFQMIERCLVKSVLGYGGPCYDCCGYCQESLSLVVQTNFGNVSWCDFNLGDLGLEALKGLGIEVEQCFDCFRDGEECHCESDEDWVEELESDEEMD